MLSTKKFSLLPLILSSASIIGALILIIKDPALASRSAIGALEVCRTKLLPTLFPAMAATTLLSLSLSRNSKKSLPGFADKLTRALFALPGDCLMTIILSFVCGFPLGAKSAQTLYKRGTITKAQASHMAAFLDFCSPVFLITAVGEGLIGSRRAGIIMYLSQTLCAILFGAVFAPRKDMKRSLLSGQSNEVTKIEDENASNLSFSDIPSAIISSARSFIDICAFVVFFSLLSSSLAASFGYMNPISESLLRGFFEISSGVFSQKGLSAQTMIVLSSFICAFSGMSVFFQVFSFLCDEKISVGRYILSRIICAPLCSFFSFFLCRIFL